MSQIKTHASSRKVCDENKRKKKDDCYTNFFDGRKRFIWLYQKTAETDFDELWINDSSYNKCTKYLVMSESALKGCFQVWAHERVS